MTDTVRHDHDTITDDASHSSIGTEHAAGLIDTVRRWAGAVSAGTTALGGT